MNDLDKTKINTINILSIVVVNKFSCVTMGNRLGGKLRITFSDYFLLKKNVENAPQRPKFNGFGPLAKTRPSIVTTIEFTG